MLTTLTRKSRRTCRRARATSKASTLQAEGLEPRLLLNATLEPFLFASLPETGARFGEDVAVYGNIAVVGAPGEDTDGHTDAGAAYVFHRDSSDAPWDPARSIRLTADSPAPRQQFGKAVAVFGNDVDGYTIAVGAPHADGGIDGTTSDTGAVYVFTGNGDNLSVVQAKLVASDGQKGDQFGWPSAVAVSDNMIVVGAPWAGPHGHSSGAAYVFEKPTDTGGWASYDPNDPVSETYQPTASDNAHGDRFGISVDVHRDTIVVGAWDAGTAYVFDSESYSPGIQEVPEIARLTTGDGSELGWAVAISEDEDTIVASTMYRTFAYRREGPEWQTSANATELLQDEYVEARFGRSVDISGNIIVVSATAPDNTTYVFDAEVLDGTPKSPIEPLSDPEGDPMGRAVATDGTIVLVSATSDDFPGDPPVPEAGSVYVFALHTEPGPPSIESLTDNPDPVLQGDNLTLTANGVSGDQTGLQIDFYRDADASGDFDVALDELVGTDMNGGDGWSVNVTISTDFPTGEYTYFAQATDNGRLSNVVATTNEVASTLVTIEATDANAAESPLDNSTLTVTRTGDTAGNLDVVYSIAGTASNGEDYTALTGLVTILDGFDTATIVVIPVDDVSSEGDETVVLTLLPGDYSIGNPNTAAVTIADDDQLPLSSLHVGDLDGAASGNWKATVTIAVLDNNLEPVSNATVFGGWSLSGNGAKTECTTDFTGTCQVNSGKLSVADAETKFTVSYVDHPSLEYQYVDNFDPEGDFLPGAQFPDITVLRDGLRVAGAATGTISPGQRLTDEILGVTVDQAIGLWTAAGVDPQRLADLNQLDVRIGDLDGALLGNASAGTLVIDRDAAGFGWSIDPDASQSPQLDGVDLLSTLVHEFGHVLGLGHDVMGATLDVGVRDLSYLDDLFADTSSWYQVRQPGDANGDGRFNQWDLVAVLRADKYRSGQPADWSQGDWTGDGVFDQMDVITALRSDNYVP